jgi:hypothetical protein
MPFKKGHSGYKPKGVKEKKTAQWEALASTLTGDQSDKFAKLMDKLWDSEETKDQLIAAELYIKMVEYFKPKQARVETQITGKVGLSSIIFEDAKKDQD